MKKKKTDSISSRAMKNGSVNILLFIYCISKGFYHYVYHTIYTVPMSIYASSYISHSQFIKKYKRNILLDRIPLIDTTGVTPIARLFNASEAGSLAASWWRAIKCVTLTETPSRLHGSKLQLRPTTVDLWKWWPRSARISTPSERYAHIRRGASFQDQDERGWKSLPSSVDSAPRTARAAYVCDLLPWMQPTEQPGGARLQPGAPIRSRGLVIIAACNLRDSIIATFKEILTLPLRESLRFASRKCLLEIEHVASKFCRLIKFTRT